MKIDSSRPITGVSTSDGQKRVDKTSDAGHAQENVHLSSTSKLPQSANSGATVDTARVQEIKQAISDGNFKVNPEAVADRLLETARELIQSKKGNV